MLTAHGVTLQPPPTAAAAATTTDLILPVRRRGRRGAGGRAPERASVLAGVNLKHVFAIATANVGNDRIGWQLLNELRHTRPRLVAGVTPLTRNGIVHATNVLRLQPRRSFNARSA